METIVREPMPITRRNAHYWINALVMVPDNSRRGYNYQNRQVLCPSNDEAGLEALKVKQAEMVADRSVVSAVLNRRVHRTSFEPVY